MPQADMSTHMTKKGITFSTSGNTLTVTSAAVAVNDFDELVRAAKAAGQAVSIVGGAIVVKPT